MLVWLGLVCLVAFESYDDLIKSLIRFGNKVLFIRLTDRLGGSDLVYIRNNRGFSIFEKFYYFYCFNVRDHSDHSD